MTEDQLKTAVLQAQAALNEKIAEARSGGVTVNLWIAGSGPEIPSPSQVQLDFGQ